MRRAASGLCPFVGASPTFRQKARCMHKRWIQAIFLCHQLRQIFLLFHSADFGPSPGEAQGSARSDAGSPGSALLLRCSASAAATGSPRVLTGPCTERLRLSPSGCAAPRPHLPVPSVVPLSRRAPAHTSGLNWRGGNRARPTSVNHSLVVAPREAGPPRRLRALIGPRRTSDHLTGRRQLQRGGERKRCKRFLLAARAFPGY